MAHNWTWYNNIYSMLAEFIIICTALAGLALALYIHYKKRDRKALVCPLKARCDEVIHSEFSYFLGVPVEFLGILYFGLIVIVYLLFLFNPYLIGGVLAFIAIGISLGAFLFSAYLTFIQIFNLKSLCSWCLFSAALSSIIFTTALLGLPVDIVTFLSEFRYLIIIFHVVAAALGLGGATIADLLFFKFLKDLRISEWESGVLRFLSQIIWSVLAILLITGIGLYLPRLAIYSQSDKFLAKMVIVIILIINGSLLNLLVSPKLVKISFHKDHRHQPGELLRLRGLAFILGSISIVSWYFAFILGMLHSVNLSFAGLIILYLLIVGAAIVIGKFTSRRLGN